jgi:TolB-like protein
MFRFGDYELDLDRYELRRGGEVVKTEPRVLELLNYLIEQRERVVPKEDLLDTLWPDVHVSESALTTTIRDARRALGDSSNDAKWIRTVYGRGFHFAGDVTIIDNAPPAATARLDTHDTSRKSIVVLPFADLSPARDQRHFCDGVAEELISTLTRIRELRVVSRSAAFDFSSDDDLRALGEKFGVDHVLRGSVRKDGNRLRISVHLVDVNNGHHIWSEKYDREVGDVFALQEEIAEKTTRVLLGVLSERNRNVIKSTPVRLDAYEFYLKGRTYLGQRTPEGLQAAVRMFELALDFDPDYAPAWAGLADALAETYEKTREGNLLERADDASQRAIKLAPHLAETHVCRGNVLSLEHLYREAAAEFQIALAISPASTTVRAALRALEAHV